jgi:copper(I)-binding protein
VRLGALAALGLLVAVGTAACVHYPSVVDSGGTMLRPAKGRLVRQGDAATVYFDLKSSGKYQDVILSVHTPVAKTARLVDGSGQPLPRYEVPGSTLITFAANGPHVELAELTRPLVAGDTAIVTLVFEKFGGLGVICVIE